jgi:CheY-like chemotaxis protein
MSQLRVLVVDDSVDTVLMHAEALRSLGHLAVEAYSGEQALELYVQVDPHLILLDLGMPEMNGRALARRIRRCPEATNHSSLPSQAGKERRTSFTQATQASICTWSSHSISSNWIFLSLATSAVKPAAGRAVYPDSRHNIS